MTEPQLIAVVEIPKGGRNKYEYDPLLGGIKFDRLLMSAAAYPADYGYFGRRRRGADVERAEAIEAQLRAQAGQQLLVPGGRVPAVPARQRAVDSLAQGVVGAGQDRRP